MQYYEESNLPEKLFSNRTFLNNQLLTYNFDSLNLSFLSSTDITKKGYILTQSNGSINIIVKAEIDKSDFLAIWAIMSETVKQPQYLICQRLTKSAREEITQNYSFILKDIKIIEMSQAGAVELFIRNGRLNRIKCGNYNIF